MISGYRVIVLDDEDIRALASETGAELQARQFAEWWRDVKGKPHRPLHVELEDLTQRNIDHVSGKTATSAGKGK